MNLYRHESSNAKYNAQRNLGGRTHYVDDDTLRFHKSRVLASYVVDNGLIFSIITSDALDMNNTRRGYRYVIFDVFGTVVERKNLDDAYTTSERARKAMWAALNALDAKAHTIKEIERQRKAYESELADFAKKVRGLGESKVAA